MWTKLNDAEDAIEEIISNPKSMTINGITHSRQIFKWTTAELKAVGIVPVTTTGSHLDTNYYIEVDEAFAIAGDKNSVVRTIGVKSADKKLTDTNEVDEDGDPLLDNDGVQVVTLGLKSNAKNKATTQANGYLQGFDWLIQRKVTANTAIPSAVTTYMAAIRTDHGNICTAIDGASDMTAFIALHNDTYKEVDGKQVVDVVARVNRWTADTNVKAYRR
jgi:hypothetical protein